MKPQETAQEWAEMLHVELFSRGEIVPVKYLKIGIEEGERITLERLAAKASISDAELLLEFNGRVDMAKRIKTLEAALIDMAKIAESFRKEYNDDSYDNADVVEHHLMLFGDVLSKHQELLSELTKDGK